MRTTIEPKMNLSATSTKQAKKADRESSPRTSFDDVLKSAEPRNKNAETEKPRLADAGQSSETRKKPQPKTREPEQAPKDEPAETPEHFEKSDLKAALTEDALQETKAPLEEESHPVDVKAEEATDVREANSAEIISLVAPQTQPLPVTADVGETDELVEDSTDGATPTRSAQKPLTQQPAAQKAEANQTSDPAQEVVATDVASVSPLQKNGTTEGMEDESDARESEVQSQPKAVDQHSAAMVNDGKPAAAVEKTSAPVETSALAQQQPASNSVPSAVKTPEPIMQPHHVPQDVRFAESNHPQIVTAIRGELLPDGGKMTLKLDPPELGALQVQVHLKDGAMTATFQTSNDDATRMLSHSLASLKNSLESQGISVDKLQVQQAPRDQQAGTNQDPREQQQNQWDNPSARQEQQRRELLQRMWRKLSGSEDPLDMVA